MIKIKNKNQLLHVRAKAEETRLRLMKELEAKSGRRE